MFYVARWLDLSSFFLNQNLFTRRINDLEKELNNIKGTYLKYKEDTEAIINKLYVEKQVLENNVKTLTYSNMSTDALSVIYQEEKEEAEKRLVAAEVDVNELCSYNQELKEELLSKQKTIESLYEIVQDMKISIEEYEEGVKDFNNYPVDNVVNYPSV
jgi:chromosome segregation ATPase